MNEQGRPVRGGRRGVTGSDGNRPRPNRLSDEARPNVLHLTDAQSESHAGQPAVRTIDRPRSRRQASRSAPAATASDGAQEGQRSNPSLFTILVAGFVVINILRACLQAGG
jgi:hypothetical protein